MGLELAALDLTQMRIGNQKHLRSGSEVWCSIHTISPHLRSGLVQDLGHFNRRDRCLIDSMDNAAYVQLDKPFTLSFEFT